ncbi:hypothetical protein NEOKW01_0687 [Nematocida sp. AWRm80]|nr:hypothetical protein NEOKW01_0687 [Nematocida sp. AWRm80]
MQLSTKQRLEELQRELVLCRSNYEKGLVKEKIRKAEKELTSNIINAHDNPQPITTLSSIQSTEMPQENILRIENTSGSINRTGIYTSALITNSTNLTANIRVEHAVNIRQVTNSVMYLIGQQIRITECSNLELFVYSKTGVHLENSQNISVQEYTPESIPEYKNNYQVYSFNRCLEV